MSTPKIPGYTADRRGSTLADLWVRPAGDFSAELWPSAVLRDIEPNPGGWLTIEQSFFNDESHGGVSLVLVPTSQDHAALGGSSWLGRRLGEVGIWDSGEFDDGLRLFEEDVDVEFFVQVRSPEGSQAQPSVELAHTFLWYFDAYSIRNGWSYVNAAGREQELVRWNCEQSKCKVEVRALELRQFLYISGKTAVKQVDIVTKREGSPFARVDDEFINEWARFRYFAVHDTAMLGKPAFSGVMGRYLIKGMKNSRTSRWEEYGKEQNYPEFIYDFDPASGEPLKSSCDPNELGTYFDQDGSRLHYLTPVYFSREVLQPYMAEPSKYKLSASRLSCLGLWSLDISINTAGLVEVYLGDLGQKLPTEDRNHWLAYNVLPEGEMERGRFRRDFLNQWATSYDPVRELQQARDRISEVSTAAYGAPLWRPLSGNDKVEFESLMGPLSNDPSALGHPLLVLTKAMVDAIDGKMLKKLVSTPAEDGEKSLRTLAKLLEELGDGQGYSKVFLDLQAFRSRGGIAHLGNSTRSQVEAALGIENLSPVESFDSVVRRLTEALQGISLLIIEGHESAQD